MNESVAEFLLRMSGYRETRRSTASIHLETDLVKLLNVKTDDRVVAK